jgi:polyisoprenoid-binding protein YceI
MVDPARSSVQFSVRHMVGTLRGRFTEFEGVLEVGENGVARAAGSVKSASIDTNEPVRDGHLRESSDFFDVERHPEITFSSTHVEHPDHGMPRVFGELTMRGVTRELALSVENHSALGDAKGDGAIALQLQGELNRKQFGLAWNQVMEAGGALVGDRVKVALEILAVRADPQ